MPRRLIRDSKLTNRRLDGLVKYFALEVSAARAAGVMGINRHSAGCVYHVIRRCLAGGASGTARSAARSKPTSLISAAGARGREGAAGKR